PGQPVSASIPAVVADPKSPFSVPTPAADAQTTYARKALAKWIIYPDNPLTARVIVNRVWYHHFGMGIVPTLENFGVSGAKPTNKALLDWLASSFTQTPKYPNSQTLIPWSLKPLHRLILTSTAYRQSSAPSAEGMKVDPDDKLLWRQRQRRLEAE